MWWAGLDEVGRRVEETHHRVFDVEVDAGLLWVDADLDGIVYCPVNGNKVSGSCMGNKLPLDWDEDVEQANSRRSHPRTSWVRSMSGLGEIAEQSMLHLDFMCNRPGFGQTSPTRFFRVSLASRLMLLLVAYASCSPPAKTDKWLFVVGRGYSAPPPGSHLVTRRTT